MYRYKKILIATTIAGLVVLPSLALAAPGIPEQFYGSISYASGATPAGLSVVAYIGSTAVASSTTDNSGNYGLAPNLLIVPDQDGTLTGTVITFTVNGTVAIPSATFANASLTNLSLTVVGAAPGSSPPVSPPASSSSGSSGGGGGGGGGGSISTAVTTSVVPTISTTIPTTSAPSSQGQVLGATTYNFTKNLTVGSRGTDVTELQQFLLDNKFYTGPVTGYFGQLSKMAVIVFQKANNLPQTGYVGPLTLAILNKGSVPTTAETSTSTPVSSSLTTTQANSIIGLLQAFGADATTIANVRIALGQ